MLRLVVREGPDRGKIYRLGTRVLTIGRDHRNPIQLLDPEVSRRHALVRWTGRQFVLFDLKSQNGIERNDKPHREGPLESGDRVRIGKTLLEVVPDVVGSRDAVIEGKVVGETLVGAETLEPRAPTAAPVVGETQVVDTEASEARRALALVKIVTAAREAIRGKRTFPFTHEQAADGLVRLIGADRVAVVEVAANGALETSAVAYEADDGRRLEDVPLDEAFLRRVVAMGAAASAEAGAAAPPVGAAAAAPVLRDGAVVGVLYADVAAGSGFSFVDEDQAALETVARELAPTFAARS